MAQGVGDTSKEHRTISSSYINSPFVHKYTPLFICIYKLLFFLSIRKKYFFVDFRLTKKNHLQNRTKDKVY
jgi:hypothetical protein